MAKKKAKYTIDNVMEDLVEMRHQLKDRSIDLPTAKAQHANVARMLSVVGKQMLYAKMREEKPSIPFMKAKK